MERTEFLAVGEESARGTKQVSTVGFIPLRNFSMPKPDKMEKKRGEFRGEDTRKGHTTALRYGEEWKGLSSEIPFFTEAGSTAGMMGTLLKHFFGYVSSLQNAATGQYAHMFSVPADMFSSANLGDKALTFSMNAKHGTVLKNHPYVGGRIATLKLHQEVNDSLIMTLDCMGQKLLTPEAGISSPVFAAENLRCDYNNLTIREGATVTRTGTAPNYTDITSNGNQVKPDVIDLELGLGLTDRQILDGTDTVGKTSIGIIEGKLSMTYDFEDPASGFSSVDEFTAWLAAVSSTNFLLTWDTGTQAGTGDNHSLIVDLPICNRLGDMPDFSNLDDDPKIPLEYDFHYDSSTSLYTAGILLKNTASAV